MADYAGLITTIDNIAGISPEWNYVEYSNQLLGFGTFINDDYSKAGSFDYYQFVSKVGNFNGSRSDDYSGIFYNNIWSSPDKIVLGLITRDESYNIYIFNSFDTTLTMSDIQNTVLGLDITKGTLPATFNSQEEKNYPVLIHLTGTADVLGYVKFVFSAESVIVPVTGDRIVQYAFDPIKSMSIKHNKFISRSKTHYLQQERQRINDDENREITCEMIRNDMELDVLLGYSQNRTIAVPLPMESMQVSNVGSLIGLSILNTSDDISNFFELKKCKYVMIYNKSEIEVIKISTIDYVTGTITLLSPINKDFVGNDTFIYPVVLAYITNYSASQIQFNRNKYDLTFKEVISG